MNDYCRVALEELAWIESSLNSNSRKLRVKSLGLCLKNSGIVDEIAQDILSEVIIFLWKNHAGWGLELSPPFA